MKDVLTQVLRSRRANRHPVAAGCPSPVPSGQDGAAKVSVTQSPFKRGRTCPACGSARTAALSILVSNSAGDQIAHRRCRACGHAWEQPVDQR
jgi:Zn ribbon nucleic-acid-binding protein